MATFSDESRDSVADHLTNFDTFSSPDSADVPPAIAWEPFSSQNSLALRTATPLTTLSVGQCTALLPADFERNGQIMGSGSGNDGDYIIESQGMGLSQGKSTGYRILSLPDTITHIAQLLLSLFATCLRSQAPLDVLDGLTMNFSLYCRRRCSFFAERLNGYQSGSLYTWEAPG